MGKVYASLRAGTEGKMTRQSLKLLIYHTYRKSEDKFKNHSNENIDPTKTPNNVDYFHHEKSHNGMAEYIDDRLEKEYAGKRALRKDAVLAREVITQLSSEFYEGMTEEEKLEATIEFAAVTAEFMIEEFGEDNYLGMSIHADETNFHIHNSLMMMTDDGRISQKEFFSGPQSLRLMHGRYREHLQAHGFDVEKENKHADGTKGVDTETYKRMAPDIERVREERNKAFSDRDEAYADRDEAILERSTAIKGQIKAEQARDEMLDERDLIRAQNDALLAENEELEATSDKWRRQAKKWEKKARERHKMFKERTKAIQEARNRFSNVNEFIDEAVVDESAKRKLKQFVESGDRSTLVDGIIEADSDLGWDNVSRTVDRLEDEGPEL